MKEVLGLVSEGRNNLFSVVGGVLNGMQDENAETATGIAGNWSDLFYWFELGINGVVGAFTIAIATLKELIGGLVEPAMLTISTIKQARNGGINAISARFRKLGADVGNIFIDMANSVLKTVNRLGDKLNYILPKSLEI